MKTLLLMRHAKASWKDPQLSDQERPLNKRGLKDALFMGKVLFEKELLPQKIMASSALRARQTVSELTKGSGYTGEIEFTESLYLAEPDVYFTVLQQLPDSIERVMLIGHNPGIEMLLKKLTGRIESMGTGSIASIYLPNHKWIEFTDETEGDLIELLRLSDLRDTKKQSAEKQHEEKKHKEDMNKDKKKRKKGESKKQKK